MSNFNFKKNNAGRQVLVARSVLPGPCCQVRVARSVLPGPYCHVRAVTATWIQGFSVPNRLPYINDTTICFGLFAIDTLKP